MFSDPALQQPNDIAVSVCYLCSVWQSHWNKELEICLFDVWLSCRVMLSCEHVDSCIATYVACNKVKLTSLICCLLVLQLSNGWGEAGSNLQKNSFKSAQWFFLDHLTTKQTNLTTKPCMAKVRRQNLMYDTTGLRFYMYSEQCTDQGTTARSESWRGLWWRPWLRNLSSLTGRWS